MNNLLKRACNMHDYHFISFKSNESVIGENNTKIHSKGVVIQKCIWISIDSYIYLQAFLKLKLYNIPIEQKLFKALTFYSALYKI